MDYELKVKQEPTYLHVVGEGAHTTENLRRFLIDAHRIALERKCDSMLLEQNFWGPSLSLGNIYSVVAERSIDGSLFKRIAYVDANTEHPPERMEFAELAANKLGVNVRSFRTVSEAKSWLQSSVASHSRDHRLPSPSG